MHGVGALEATVLETDGTTVPVLNDFAGNVLATLASSGTTWNPIRVGVYGPVMGYRPNTPEPGTELAESVVWRSRWMDPSGFYCLGARYYDPVAGHFLSPDPLGHSASMDLYSMCSGDPLNKFDPTGCFGKGAMGGLSDQGVPGNANSAYMAGYFLGGIDQGFAQGFGEGAAIDANFATAGQIDSLNSYANSLQGDVYTASRWLGGGGLGLLGLTGVAAALPVVSEYAAYGLTYAGSALLEGLGAASEYGGAVWGGGLASATAIGVGSLENGQFSELAPGLEDLAQSRLSLEAETPGIMATKEDLITISEHLSTVDADPGNAIMYQRLLDAYEAGTPLTSVDANFYEHELIESGLVDSGIERWAAHAQTLEIQGIPYVKGYTSSLYTPQALQASEAATLQEYLNALKWKP
jgi:RHS repeat-associated protein